MRKMLHLAVWILTALMLFVSLRPCPAYAKEPDENTQWLVADPVDVTTYEDLVDVLRDKGEEADENNIVWIDVARLAADITIGSGQEVHSRGFLVVPAGRTLTIEDGGNVIVSFQIEKGGTVLVKNGGYLGTTMGDDCINHGRFIVEPEAAIQSQMGAAIINAADGYMKLDGIFDVGSYRDFDGVNREWYGNSGSLEGQGFIVVRPVAMVEGEAGLAARMDIASRIKSSLPAGSGIKVLVSVFDSAEMKQLNGEAGIDGFWLDMHNPYEDEPEEGEDGDGSGPKYFIIADSMDTTGKVVCNTAESVLINPGVSFTTDCYLSNSDIFVQDSTLTVNGKFTADNLVVGDTLVIGNNADIDVGHLLFSWPSAPCKVRNVTADKISYGAMYDLGDGSEPVSMNESEGGKFYVPGSPTRDGYTFAGWKITSGWQGSSAWTSAMTTALSGMKVKTDANGSYVEESDLFPLSITAQWQEAKKQFTDVQDPSHAYYTAIYWAAENGITKGYSDGSFGINNPCTRGHAVMFLWNMAGRPAPKTVSASPFKDVPKTHAYYKAVLWAQQKGITKGYTTGAKKGTFGIDETCTRGQIMMFIWRYKGQPAPKTAAKSPFSDVPTTHSYYKAILWGSQNGVTKGYTTGAKKGQFGINDSCTRGQIVKFLYNIR